MTNYYIYSFSTPYDELDPTTAPADIWYRNACLPKAVCVDATRYQAECMASYYESLNYNRYGDERIYRVFTKTQLRKVATAEELAMCSTEIFFGGAKNKPHFSS